VVGKHLKHPIAIGCTSGQHQSGRRVLILAGPTLGSVNTGIGIFEASDEETARAIIAEDPVARGGFARAELRPYQLGFARRD
jgi:uncharacterized protein YciI